MPGHVFPLDGAGGRGAATGPATRRRPWISRASRGCTRPASSARCCTPTASMARMPELSAVARGARLEDHLDRRPDRVPAHTRGAGRRDRRGDDPHAARRRSAPTPTRAPSTGACTSRMVLGEVGDGDDILVRVHSECLTGDVFGSMRCDCGDQLDRAIARDRRARAAASSCTCVATRGARSASPTSSGPTSCRSRAATRSRRTSSSGSRRIPATTGSARRSWSTSACARCAC